MEKTDLAYVLPANFGWDDLGDWNSLERLITSNQDYTQQRFSFLSKGEVRVYDRKYQ